MNPNSSEESDGNDARFSIIKTNPSVTEMEVLKHTPCDAEFLRKR